MLHKTMQNLGKVKTNEVGLSLEIEPNEVQKNIKNENINQHPVETVQDITYTYTNETHKSTFIGLSNVVDDIKCSAKSTYIQDDSTYKNSDLAINNSVSELDAEEVVNYVDTMDFLQSDDEGFDRVEDMEDHLFSDWYLYQMEVM